jgi:hypothetical protein
MKNLLPLLIVIIIVISSSCNKKQNPKDSFQPVFSTYKSDTAGSSTTIKKHEIFYGLLTPVEVSGIFNRLGLVYYKSILNPVSKKDLYLSTSEAAINTGIYGADLGYLKMFGVGQEMVEYVLAIRSLSNNLGIPDEYLKGPLKFIESDLSDADSIMSVMNSAYYSIEAHLREGGRESTAGLMVMGGWIEAMYIATQLAYDPANPDPEVVQKIAEQKYSLTSLLSFLKNYYNDPIVVYYTKKLLFLKNYFDTFDIVFRKGDLEIDTTRQLFRASGSEMNVTVQTMNNIRDYISKLRTEVVTP